MKLNKKILLIVILILLVNLTLVYAKDYTLKTGDSVTIEGKKVTLENAGSGGSIVVDVDGILETILANEVEIINNLEITNVEVYWAYDKPSRSAKIEIVPNGEECYVDNYCDFKRISDIKFFHGEKREYYRGRSLDVTNWDQGILKLKVDDGQEIILLRVEAYSDDSAISNYITSIGGIGLNYNSAEGYLSAGENFINCPNDCSIDKDIDRFLIIKICSNEKKDEITQEEDIDCDGLCERKCEWECMDTVDCECSDIGKTLVPSCFCKNNKCIDFGICEINEDCIQVKNDCCGGCDAISINKKYFDYWNEHLERDCHSMGCLRPCDMIKYESTCENNVCKLTDKKIEEEGESHTEPIQIIEEETKESNIEVSQEEYTKKPSSKTGLWVTIILIGIVIFMVVFYYVIKKRI